MQEEYQTNLSAALDEKHITGYFKSLYGKTISDLQKEFDDRFKKLKKEYNIELEEEKNATKYNLFDLYYEYL